MHSLDELSVEIWVEAHSSFEYRPIINRMIHVLKKEKKGGEWGGGGGMGVK